MQRDRAGRAQLSARPPPVARWPAVGENVQRAFGVRCEDGVRRETELAALLGRFRPLHAVLNNQQDIAGNPVQSLMAK
jgi:hypothetical protein